MSNITQNSLYRLMHPRHIAVVGASNNMLNMGTRILDNLLCLEYQGEVFPVHPRLSQVLGLKAYGGVKQLPLVPDLALIVVPTAVVPEVMGQCGEKGIRRAIVVSGGFREAGNQGRQREKELTAIASHHGMRFLGPNCIGVINPAHRFNTTVFHYTAAMNGFIGMASQSGSFITQMFYHLEKFGLGFSQGFSVGNQADIDLADCMDYLGSCERTRVIGLYIEGITHPKKFMRVAREVSQKKPIVAMYVGGTEAGSRAGLSHSGAMAGSDAIHDGIFRQCGIVRAATIEELFDFCWALGSQPLIKGKRIAVFTHSGGPGAIAADAADRDGLQLPPLSPETRAKLAPFVPHTGSVNNPIDTTYIRNLDDIMLHIPRVLLEDDQIDGILIYFLLLADNYERLLGKADSPLFQSLAEFEEYALALCRRLGELVKSHQKPFLGSSFLMRSEKFIGELEDLNIPVLPSPERSARAMGALYRYSRMREALCRRKRQKPQESLKKAVL